MDRTLEAEMEAARAAARRMRALRDVLIAAEDRGSSVLLGTTDGSVHTGTITAVGVDHIEISNQTGCRILALIHLVSLEER
ncbi:MAG: hypothetical protein WD184_08365 [Acidimicrobiia bacterium]